MNRIARFLTLAATSATLAAGLGACAASNVGVASDFDHSVNFRNYRTWAWYPKQVADTEGGPARGYESFADQRIRAAVGAELAKRGMTEAPAGTQPDVYLAYSVRVENKQQLNPGMMSPWGWGGWGYGGWGMPMGGGVYNYKAGTVVIDVVDARRKELAWRGTGQAQLDKNQLTEQETYRIVNSILAQYPPNDARQRASR